MNNDHSFKSDTLPREIMAEILCQLPVESLIRLKSLNKPWYFFIRYLVKDPEFVSKHLHYSESLSKLLLIRKHMLGVFDPPEKKSTGQIDNFATSALVVSFSGDVKEGDEFCNYDDSLHCVTKDLDFPRCLSHLLCGKHKMYGCNGIICLSEEYASTFTLYNPVLCEFDTFSPSTDLNLDEHNVIGMGFGCNSTGSIYKVVRLFDSMKAEVFVLGGASDSWREIDMNINLVEDDVLLSHVYLKGHSFWSVSGRLACTVVCFDVGAEVFHEIPLPDKSHCHHFESFRRCKDSICAMLYSGYDVEVWMLDASCCRGGCSYSWKMLQLPAFEIAIGFVFAKWYAFWDADRGEMLVDRGKGLFESYNVFYGTVRSLPFRLRTPVRSRFSRLRTHKAYYLDYYVESLVPIKSFNKARRT